MKLICLLLVLFIAQPVAALDVAAYKLAKTTPGTAELNEMYVLGVGQGISWTNSELATKKTPLFCPPARVALDAQNYVQMLDQHIKYYQETSPNYDTNHAPIEFILLRAMQYNFPCQPR